MILIIAKLNCIVIRIVQLKYINSKIDFLFKLLCQLLHKMEWWHAAWKPSVIGQKVDTWLQKFISQWSGQTMQSCPHPGTIFECHEKLITTVENVE